MSESRGPQLVAIIERDAFASDEVYAVTAARLAEALVEAPAWVIVRAARWTGSDRAQLFAKTRARIADGRRVLLGGSTDEAVSHGFAGVHWPERCIPNAPPAVPDTFAIGASVHGVAATHRAELAGAWFAVFAPVLAPSSKPVRGRGFGALAEVARSTELPVIALGGIGPARARDCVHAGAAGIGAMSGFATAGDPIALAFEYLDALSHFERRRAQP